MAFVQATNGSGISSATTTTTTGITTTSGNLLVFWWMAFSNRSVRRIQDTYNNYWITLPKSPVNDGRVGYFTYGFYCPNIVGGASHTITVTYSGAAVSAMGVLEMSGRHPTTPIGAINSFDEGSRVTSHTSGSLSYTTGSDVICICSDSANFDLGSNQTYTSTSSGWTKATNACVTTAATTGSGYAAYSAADTTNPDTCTWTAGSITACGYILELLGAPASATANTTWMGQ